MKMVLFIMMSLRIKDLLVEEVKDPLLEEVSLMGQKYLFGALASKVMGLVVVATLELGIPGPSESCCISTVGKLLMMAVCVCSFSSCDGHLC